jgi:hypothetical protein
MQVLIPLLVTIAVIFWREALKILLMVAVILIITVVAFGAVGLLEGMQHIAR